MSSLPPQFSEGEVEAVLESSKKALGFHQYRTAYEAENSYISNKSKLESVQDALRVAAAAAGATQAHKALFDNASKLVEEWDAKWAKQKAAREAHEAQLEVGQLKDDWLRKLAEENEAAAEAEAKRIAEAKEAKKKKKAKKTHKRRGLGGTSSSDDDENQREIKGHRGGMERGSSLLGLLDPEEARRVERQAAEAAARAAESGQALSAPEPLPPVAEFNGAFFHSIPAELLEARDNGSVVCNLKPIENTPLVEITFTHPLSSIPMVKLPQVQKQGGRNMKKQKGRQTPPPPTVAAGQTVLCSIIAFRVVVAAQLVPQPSGLMTSSHVPMPTEDPHKTVAPAAAEVSADVEDSDEEMVVQDTPDNWDATSSSDDSDDGAEGAEKPAKARTSGTNAVHDDLRKLSEQLVAQYSEVEQEGEDEDYGRHAKARDLPPAISRSLSHWRSLSDATWVVMMCHGGYFAGAVFAKGVPILHKAFHRYVVRKKQGGKQSKHDKGGGSMASAGGQIRRHHELKWKATVRDIVLTWKNHIDAAALILYVAPGPDNRAILTDFKEAPPSALSLNMGPGAQVSPIDMKDPRVRSAPMTTHRPTFAEVKRIYETVSRCNMLFREGAETNAQ